MQVPPHMFSRIFSYGLLLICTFVLTGCYEDESDHLGSVRGVEICVENNKSDLASQQSVRDYCVRKHSAENDISDSVVSGSGGLRKGSITNRIFFRSTVRNNSEEYAITEISMVLEYGDPKKNILRRLPYF